MIEFLSHTNIQLFILAYVVGSIPFGFLLAYKFAGLDVRELGSGGIGATNVLRVVKDKDANLGKKLAVATLALDILKGLLFVLGAKLLGVAEANLWGVAILLVLGHCYSLFLKFEGGKGVATGLGVLVVLVPLATLIGAAVWAISAKVLKISSISSLLGLLFVVIAAVVLDSGLGVESNVPLYLIAFIISYKHIPNIIRVFKGEEKRVV
jgi:glycerol-3-phosphate acyltransferase PlsY